MEPSNRDCLNDWLLGSELAATTVVSRFDPRLLRFAQRHLGRSARIDPQDVVGSTWGSFFDGVQHGQIHAPESDDLWPILVAILARKIHAQRQRQRALRRDTRRETETPIDTIVAEPPQISSEMQWLQERLSTLPERDQQTLRRLLAGQTQTEIADELNIAERTIYRLLQRLREEYTQRNPLQRIAYHDVMLEEFLGKGTFAKVYRALLAPRVQPIAVKYLQRRFWSNQMAVTQILQEAQVASRLRHSHLVQHRGWGTTPNGGIFLVLDWIEGHPLSHFQKAEVSFICKMGIQLAEALHTMHSAGIVHGDISPMNVIVQANGDCVLIDFGFARFFEDSTQQGFVCGTRPYMAPEQFQTGRTNPSTDIYALGSVLFHIFSGETYQGEPHPDFPPVLQRCLSLNPNERPHSAEEIAQRLRGLSL